MSGTLQFLAQFQMVVDLPVEGDHGIAARIPHGLHAARQIPYLQSSRGDRYHAGLKHRLLIRPAVREVLRSSGNQAGLRQTLPMSVPGNSTQLSSLFLAGVKSPSRPM